jgi:hypothetical protein
VQKTYTKDATRNRANAEKGLCWIDGNAAYASRKLKAEQWFIRPDCPKFAGTILRRSDETL